MLYCQAGDICENYVYFQQKKVAKECENSILIKVERLQIVVVAIGGVFEVVVSAGRGCASAAGGRRRSVSMVTPPRVLKRRRRRCATQIAKPC